ncbi:hypothetical protein OEG84_19640 [Hoeflea sp. G2-23]|uniref:Uncharacterized protein n=1 Tax=Hoeflea algicola TaxID=2983763 RepID=A0ABT3ZDY0_9HYPH|nr:hypothetical protein [Hoeflea algicola]MCY0149851.1 hypothetical protein [Hoeflea algicola]
MQDALQLNNLHLSTKLPAFNAFRPSIVKGIGNASAIDQAFESLRIDEQLAESQDSGGSDIASQLFDARSKFKIFVSQVSMHLKRDWIDNLFMQIDSILDSDEWDTRDPAPTFGSAKTLIRMLLTLRAERRPGLGASNRKTLLAAWTTGPNRLTVECLEGDRVRWVLARTLADGSTERAAGEGGIERLANVLTPYNPEIWLKHAK